MFHRVRIRATDGIPLRRISNRAVSSLVCASFCLFSRSDRYLRAFLDGYFVHVSPRLKSTQTSFIWCCLVIDGGHQNYQSIPEFQGSNIHYAETGEPKVDVNFNDQTIRAGFIRKVFGMVTVMVLAV